MKQLNQKEMRIVSGGNCKDVAMILSLAVAMTNNNLGSYCTSGGITFFATFIVGMAYDGNFMQAVKIAIKKSATVVIASALQEIFSDKKKKNDI